MPTKFLGTVRQKIFDGNLWYPLLCIKFFDTPNFLKHWRDAHEIFRHCETQNFRRKNVIPPSMHKISRYPKFSETLKVCPRNFSALWDKKFSTEICDTPYYAESFSIRQIFWDIEGMPTNFFGTVRPKIFDGKTWYPLVCIKFLDTPNFLKHWRYAHEIFRHCETKSFRRKNVIPPVCIKFFDSPDFLKHWRDAHEIFRHCETKNFRRKLVIPPIMHKVFRYPKFSETLKGCPRNFSALWDQKFSTETRDIPYYA